MFEETEFSLEDQQFLLDKVPFWQKAVCKNCVPFDQCPGTSLLMPGAQYFGFWLEHNQDNFFAADLLPEAAWNSQRIIMKMQRQDGLFPFMLPLEFNNPQSGYYGQKVCYWHIQSVWPFSRCALEIAKKLQRPEEDFFNIYRCGSAFDAWLSKYRDHDQLGLVEMFCEYDTGHDNSPRVTDDNIPATCPGNDAVQMPDLPVMPILSVDLSAMRFGMREALCELAGLLGYHEEAEKWRERAEKTRLAIETHFFDSEEIFYFDRDRQGLRKYRSEHITRLFLNRVLTQEQFDAVYEAHFSTPGKGFCTPFPIPSMAADDPHFVPGTPSNCWGRNTQALTSLRAVLWMDFYHRSGDLDALLGRWLKSCLLYPETTYPQELDPFTGQPIGNCRNYTPTLLLLRYGAKRLFCREKMDGRS